MRAFPHHLVPFDEPPVTAAAARLNEAGRTRIVWVDAMIAATALVADAKLATNNRDDFSAFTASGVLP